MEIVLHRLNAIADLKKITNPAWGCEIDLRSDLHRKERIHLSHDAWVEGADFEEWLTEFRKLNCTGPLILNTKEDGLEKTAQELMAKFSIKNFFFLDTTVPTLVKLGGDNREHFSIRISRYEDFFLRDSLPFAVGWLWLDCFQGEPWAGDFGKLKSKGEKVCLVSPELQGMGETKIQDFLYFKKNIDYVCTKFPHLWNS